MTNEHLREPDAEPDADERIAEFAGSLDDDTYPPGYLEHERRGWDGCRDDARLDERP